MLSFQRGTSARPLRRFLRDYKNLDLGSVREETSSEEDQCADAQESVDPVQVASGFRAAEFNP